MAKKLGTKKNPYTGDESQPVIVPVRLVVNNGGALHPMTKKLMFGFEVNFNGYASLEAANAGQKPMAELSRKVTNLTPGASTDTMTAEFFRFASKSLFDIGLVPPGAPKAVVDYAKSVLVGDFLNAAMWAAGEAKDSVIAAATAVTLTGGPLIDPAAAAADVPWIDSPK